MSKNTNLSFLTDYITADITNGRIGINNASPTVAFDVVGATKITGVLTLTSTISNGTYAYTLPSATGTLALTSALSGYLPLTGGTLTGALGIGNTASSPLDVTADNSTAINLRLRGRALDNVGQMEFWNNAQSTRFGYIATDSSNMQIFTTQAIPLIFGTNTTTRLTIASTGAATFSSSVTATSFGGNVYPFNSILGIGADASTGTVFAGSTSGYVSSIDVAGGGATNPNTIIFKTASVERMRITSAGNVGIGTSAPSYKLQVNGNGYFSGALTVDGTIYSPSLILTAAINTYNVVQFFLGTSYSFTPPNFLNASSDNSQMRMYMVWVWGANGATYAGCRVWMIAVNGGGTAYTVNTLLGRDAADGTGLDLTRTSATQLTITSNNAAYIKWVSIMQLNTNT